jgi:signal transduction histidine kinase
VAITLIALVALMLVAEGALFLWMSDLTAGAMPGRNPQQMTRLVASDLSGALEANPRLDIEPYLREMYGHYYQTILVVMRDGSILMNHEDASADDLRAAAELRGFVRSGRRGRGGPGPPGFGGFGGRDRTPRTPPGDDTQDLRRGPEGTGTRPDPPSASTPGDGAQGSRRPSDDARLELTPPLPPDDGFDLPRRRPPFPAEMSSIVVGGSTRGLVALVPGNPPFYRIVRLAGPPMGLVAGGVLVVGGSLIALLVFGPARRRLLQVQDATERLGGGDLLARAPEEGGDEIAGVARSFNHMADELARRAKDLESSDRVRRQLLADVSHELMTPLTAMRGYVETLGMPNLPLDPPTRERYMRIVTEETYRLEHVIGDLLDLARLEGGGTTMRRERVELDMIFDRVAERHERELSERGIQLVHALDADAEHVVGDPDRLEQALQNLVANALRFTPDDGRIALSTSVVDDSVRITVADTGPGIPPDHLPLIFDRFSKVDASRKAAGGSGLGLSIVKAIIERHGGRISARNDGGAVFEIILPRDT